MPLFSATPPNACIAYNNLRTAAHGHCREGREHCEDLWRDFEPLADANFLTEFPVHLHERWFEMYLTVALMRAGLTVECRKPGPDILLTVNSQRIWIEASCATAGTEGLPDSVPAPVYARAGEQPKVTNRPTGQMALRIRNTLSTKEAIFRGYREAGIVEPGDAAVIAINVHSVHNLWADMADLMMRSLYGVGDLMLSIDRETGTIVDQRHQQLASISKKSTGAAVGVQPFIDGSISHVSAVIGSRADAVNLPRRLGDDTTLFPNLTAATPWPVGAIPLGEEWQFAQVEDGWNGNRIAYIA